jgi:hypothetical protein
MGDTFVESHSCANYEGEEIYHIPNWTLFHTYLISFSGSKHLTGIL